MRMICGIVFGTAGMEEVGEGSAKKTCRLTFLSFRSSQFQLMTTFHIFLEKFSQNYF